MKNFKTHHVMIDLKEIDPTSTLQSTHDKKTNSRYVLNSHPNIKHLINLQINSQNTAQKIVQVPMTTLHRVNKYISKTSRAKNLSRRKFIEIQK
jgi:hypothetical protein